MSLGLPGDEDAYGNRYEDIIAKGSIYNHSIINIIILIEVNK